MDSTTAPTATPTITDIAPPLKTAAVKAAPLETDTTGQVSSESPQQPAVQPVPAKPARAPAPGSSPTLAITVAVLLFIILSGIAYYAYSKSN